ncbi:uncharacterized protein CEXT_389631 [Caerostris extrusa]|uniref:Methyltransferase type 11 domain-containing protein n=1 Tax=Caerostris extrusa TaxID=172846 RepID=A0AAV4U604_CAEEX|nr:uncharacterized protein CEXT_389631 [Caerostris extrusa]
MLHGSNNLTLCGRFKTHSSQCFSKKTVSIKCKSTLKEWEGKISKLVFNQCFHQVKDYKTCFQNVFKLLKPGGEAAIFFCLQSGYAGWHWKLIDDPAWKKYFNGKLPEMPSTQFTDIMASDYETMLQKIGFLAIEYKTEARFISFERDKK